MSNLRRSVVLSVVALALVFAFAFAGTGVAQLLFKHQADGSITAQGSTLIGQNWADASCPGRPLGSCVFHGRPDDTGPYSSGDNPLVACQTFAGKQPDCISGESAGTNLGPR